MDANQDVMLRELHGALFNPISSLSAFRALGEGAVLQQHQLPINDDGFEHPQWLEWAARHGDSRALAQIEALAAGSTAQYPDRAQDIALAQAVLSSLQSGGAPVLPGPAPFAPAPSPVATDVVEPVAAPVKVPGTLTINSTQVLTWIKDGLTIIGAIGTWATAAHGVLGQYLDNGAAGTAVPASLAVATAISASHTVRQKTQAQKMAVHYQAKAAAK